MNIIIVLSLLACSVYVMLIFYFRSCWKRHPEFIPATPKGERKLSVIVAFRNELNNLPCLIASLEKQDLVPSKYEVIFSDDGSNDGSAQYIEDYCIAKPNYVYCKSVSGEWGKKKAVSRAISKAVNEIIVLTDADCTVPERWLSSLLSFHETRSPSIAAGLVSITGGHGFFAGLQEMEFMSLAGAGAASVLCNRPIFCSGANLSYPRDVFSGLTDPLNDNIVSGDDTFIVHNVKKNESGKIMFVKCKTSIVITRSAGSFSEFYNQRLRWVSKVLYYRDIHAITVAISVYVTNLSVLTSLIIMLSFGNCLWLFPVLFTMKASADYLFLKDIMEYCDKRLNFLYYITGALLYPFYSVITPFVSIIKGFNWKGRYY